MNNILIATK